MNNYFLSLNEFPNSNVIENMRKYAKAFDVPIIQDEGLLFLLYLVKNKNIKRVLEIGTAIGFSSINMASVNSSIVIDTIERDEKMYNEAIKNIKEANMDDRINVFYSDALLIDNNLLKKYDLIFIDAAKAQYTKFFLKFQDLLNEKGIIFTDNLLFHGLVNSDKTNLSKNLRSLVTKIEGYNEWLKNNQEFDTTFFSIGDGIAVSVKR